MKNNTDEIGRQAAQSTMAFNPIVGAQFSELLRSAAYVAVQAVRHPRVVGGHLFFASRADEKTPMIRKFLRQHKVRRYQVQDYTVAET